MQMTPKEFVEAWKKGHIPDEILMRLGAAEMPPKDRKIIMNGRSWSQ
jgi:hypothetical protein